MAKTGEPGSQAEVHRTIVEALEKQASLCEDRTVKKTKLIMAAAVAALGMVTGSAAANDTSRNFDSNFFQSPHSIAIEYSGNSDDAARNVGATGRIWRAFGVATPAIPAAGRWQPMQWLARQRPDKAAILKAAKAKTRETRERNSKPRDTRKFSDKLPSAVQKNPRLERDMMNAITSVYKSVLVVKGAILTSNRWVVTRNPHEHYRSMDAVILAKHIGKHENLGCFYQYFDFKQRSNGGGWGRAGRNSSGQRFYIDCSKI